MNQTKKKITKAVLISKLLKIFLRNFENIPKSDLTLLRRYNKIINRIWEDQAALGIERFTDDILFEMSDVTDYNVSLAQDRLAEDMTKIVDRKIWPARANSIRNSVKMVYAEQQKNAFRRAKRSVRNYNRYDRRAQTAMLKHDLYWIGNHYNRHVRTTVANKVHEALKQGWSRQKLASQLRLDLGQYMNSPGINKNYWQVVANSSVIRSRTISHLITYKRLRIKYYQWSAVGDDRTCPICLSLDGHTWPVSKGFEIVQKAITTDDPEQLKTIWPWYTRGEFEDLTYDDIQGLDALPPIHGLCRCVLIPV